MTYATNSQKSYEKYLEEQQKKQNQQLAAYTDSVNAAADQYKKSVDAAYGKAIAANSALAGNQVKEVKSAYDGQFDANAAEQMAAERNLQRQMANAGITQSGYNATNMTAIAAARANADAETRAKKQAAVDAITQSVQEYNAQIEQQKAEKTSATDYETAQRITERVAEQQDAAEKMAYNLYTSDTDTALKNRQYVEDHNNEIYSLVLDAYKNGNMALAEEYAKDLWKINADGTISKASFDTRNASYQAQAAAVASPVKAESAEPYPSIFNSTVSNARKYAEDGDTEAAFDAIYQAVLYDAANGTGMTRAQLQLMCLDAGVSFEDCWNYINSR